MSLLLEKIVDLIFWLTSRFGLKFQRFARFDAFLNIFQNFLQKVFHLSRI